MREAMRECRVALLQEVSGDQHVALRKAMPELAIIEHAYPRFPRQRVPIETLAELTQNHEVIAPLDKLEGEGAAVRRGESVRVEVVVRTRKVGHFFPGGTVDAFDVWVELEATDD